MSDVTQREDSADPIGRLVRLAGPRTPIPPERAARVRAEVARVWERTVRRRRVRRLAWVGVGAAAAAAALALGLRTLAAEAPAILPRPAARVAAIERVEGLPEVRSDDGSTRVVVAGMEVRAGDRLETGAGDRLALRLETGHSVRLDRRSRLRVGADSGLHLDRGAVYVDSDTADRVAHVFTARGRVEEIGTQFEVRFEDEILRIRVREGSIRLDGSEGVAAGSELVVAEDGARRRRPIARHGAAWSWTQEIAPAFELEGSTLAEYLDWVSRETGRTIRFQNRDGGPTATEVRLHGDLGAIRPEQTLAAVLPTCGLRHRLVEDGWQLEEVP